MSMKRGLASIFRRGDAGNTHAPIERNSAALARALGVPATVPPPPAPLHAAAVDAALPAAWPDPSDLLMRSPAAGFADCSRAWHVAAACETETDPVPDEAEGEEQSELFDAAMPSRVVLSIDATGSRSIGGWAEKSSLHDAAICLLPPHCAVALAIYHNKVETFTGFIEPRDEVRALARKIWCNGGRECVPEVLARASALDDLAAVINITDDFAVCDKSAYRHAEALREQETPVFFLIDRHLFGGIYVRKEFAWIAEHTGGAVLPFDAASLPEAMQQINQAILWRVNR